MSGRTCQVWAQQSPHKHDNTPSKRLEAGLIGNQCRNPGGQESSIWCYTTDPSKRWELCDPVIEGEEEMIKMIEEETRVIEHERIAK